jgi:diamine N-acetyltransferase
MLLDCCGRSSTVITPTSPRFGDLVRLRTFETRRQTLLAKGDAGGLRVELVTLGADGPKVAYCVSTISAEGVGEIDSIFVEESLRGRGIGAELMRHALAWLDRMQATSKILAVMYENNEALVFYARFGFHPRTVVLQQSGDGPG